MCLASKLEAERSPTPNPGSKCPFQFSSPVWNDFYSWDYFSCFFFFNDSLIQKSEKDFTFLLNYRNNYCV